MNPYVVIKGASLLKKYWKQILLFFIALLMIPIMFATSFVVIKTVPAADEEIIRMYISGAQSASEENVKVDWRDLMAIDAVRYKQNFKDVKSGDVLSLGESFIEEYIEERKVIITNIKGEEVERVEKVTAYRRKNLDQVMDEMGFSEEEKRDIKLYRDIGLNLLNEQFGGGILIDGEGVPLNLTQEEFINKVIPGAESTYKKYGVLPSISISQAILESGWGSSGLTAKANNLFGIKAFYWSGKYVEMLTYEWYGGVKVEVKAAFRAYDSWDHSLEDHGKFLVENSIYSEAGFFNAKDHIGQAFALQRAGYATDPNYAVTLISLIEQYNLHQYDKK